MLKTVFIFLVFLGGITPGIAQKGLTLSGKLRLLASTEIKVTSIEGEKIFSVTVKNGQEFRVGPKKIIPDVYVLSIGNTNQPIYLTNQEVTIKGFYNEKDSGMTSLSFTGIDDFLSLSRWVPAELSAKERTVDPGVKGELQGNMYSALAYIADMVQYEPNEMLLELVPEKDRDTLLLVGWNGEWIA